MQIRGVIDNISSKTVNTKRGPAPVYLATVDGVDGVINLGFKHNYEEGQFIDVEAYEKYGEWQISKGNSGGQSRTNTNRQTSKPRPAATNAGPAFPVPVNTKDTSIIRQNALTNARSIVQTMIETGNFKPKKAEEIVDKVLELAYPFTDFSTGQREEKLAKAKAAYKEQVDNE